MDTNLKKTNGETMEFFQIICGCELYFLVVVVVVVVSSENHYLIRLFLFVERFDDSYRGDRLQKFSNLHFRVLLLFLCFSLSVWLFQCFVIVRD